MIASPLEVMGMKLASALRLMRLRLQKSQLYIGPRGGKWADPQHTIPWELPKPGGHAGRAELAPVARRTPSVPAQLDFWTYRDPTQPSAEPVVRPVVEPALGHAMSPADNAELEPGSREWVPDLHSYDHIVVNSSGGKDSEVQLDRIVELCDRYNVPRSKILVVHADLGRVEWPETKELAERQAKRYGLRFEVVKRSQGDLIDEIRDRHVTLSQRAADAAVLAAAGITTWGELASASVSEIAGHLSGDDTAKRATKLRMSAQKKVADKPVDFGAVIAWPSSAARYCTSDHKTSQVRKLFTQLGREAGKRVRILNCLGIRAAESDTRSKMLAWQPDEEDTGTRHVDRWHPIHHWSEAEVWDHIRSRGLEYHKAYDLGMSRLSCAFCVFSPKRELVIAAQHNPELFETYLSLEKEVGATFRVGMSLTEVADELHKLQSERMPPNLVPLSSLRIAKAEIDALAAALVNTPGLIGVQWSWKHDGACVHVVSDTGSHHVTWVPYPAAYGASMSALAMADAANLPFRDEGEPPELDGVPMDKAGSSLALSAETARAIMASPSFVLRSMLHEQALHIPTSPSARLRIEQDLVSLANDVYANPLYARDVAWTPEERAAGRVVAAEMIALANRLARGLSKATAHVGEVHRWQDGKNHRKTADGWVEVPAGKPRFHILDNESEDELSMGEGTGAKPLTLDEAVAERDQYGTPIVVAYGMGVDSTAMLVGMHQRGVRPDKILFADTGGEKPETYAYRAYMDAWLAKHDFPPITVLKQKPTTNERGTYATLEENCLINNTLPSLAFGGRSCSTKWKHAPQHAFLRKDEAANEAWAKGRKLTKLIGYDAGPIDARRPHIGDDEHYRYAYPLREWGWDREESKRQIAAAGLPVPPKSACFFCPSSKPQELRELGADLLRRIVRMEAGAEGRQLERIKQGQKAIEGLWRAPVAGNRGATARPGSMTEFIAGEGLLPELAGQAEPWWNDNVDTPADTGAPDLFGYRPPTKVKRKVPVKARFPVEAMASLLQKALVALDGALSKALPSRSVKPPRGFTPIPNSKHNGFHKRVNGKWVTWYPGHLDRPHPTERFTHEEHEENHAKYQLSLPEAKRKPEYRGRGGAFFRDAKIGARVSIPNGTGKVVDINHNGTIKVRLDTGEDVNVYTNRVDAEPDKYRISHEPSADMSWSELYAISKVDAKSPQLADALREKAKRTGRNATDADHQYMTVLGSMTGSDLVWLANHPAGSPKDGPDATSVVPKSTDSWASIWAWSKTRDARTDRKAIQMLKRKAAVQGRQGVDDHAQMYMDNLGALFDVDLSEIAKEAAFEHKLKKKAKEPVWVARDPGDVSNPSARAMIAPGDRFIAPSGRVIEVPKKLSQRKIGAWLIDEAQKDLAFRQAGRPDNPHEWLSNESRQIDFDRTSIQGMNPKNLSKSDYDTLNMLVFGDEMGPTEGQRAVAIAKADGDQNTAQTEFESIFGVSVLSKALPSRAVKPPRGFTPIPNSKHNGFHKRVNGKWVTWYPGHLDRPHPTERFTHEEHEENHAKYQLSLPEAKRKPEYRGDAGKPADEPKAPPQPPLIPDGPGMQILKEAEIGAHMVTPEGSARVLGVTPDGVVHLMGLMMRRYDVNLRDVDANPRRYAISKRATADMSWSDLRQFAHGNPRSPSLARAIREKAVTGGLKMSKFERGQMRLLAEDTGVDLEALATKKRSKNPSTELPTPHQNDTWADIWKWSQSRDASISDDELEMLKRKAADRPRESVTPEVTKIINSLSGYYGVDLAQIAEDAARANPPTRGRLAGGPYLDSKGGMWFDPDHVVPWEDRVHGSKPYARETAEQARRHAESSTPEEEAEIAAYVSGPHRYEDYPIPDGFGTKWYIEQEVAGMRARFQRDRDRKMGGKVSKAHRLTAAFSTIFPASNDEALQLPDGRFGFGPLTNAELWAKARGCEEAVRLPTNGEVWSRWPQDAMTARETDAANGAVGDLGIHQDEDGDWWYPISDYLGEMILAMSLFKAKYIKKRPTGRRDRPWRYYYKRPLKREPQPHPEYKFSDHDLGPQTWQEHFTGHPDKGGVPHAERIPLHDKLIREVLFRPGPDGRPPDTSPKAIPTAILMMGAPGAGKSTILAGLRQRPDVVMIDPDEFKQKLPEYQDAITDPSRMPLGIASKVHHESSYIARRARDEAISGRRNMMVDGTGRNAAAMIELCDRLRSTGYRVHLVFVHVSLEDSLSRIESRKNETGRHVPKGAAVECVELVPHSFNKVKDHVDSFDAWTTSAPSHKRLTFDNGPRAEIKRDANTRKILSKRMGGTERIHDPVLVEKFLKEPLAHPPSLAD